MHTREVIEEVLRLAERGLSATEITHQTGLSRSTVRTWLRGELPLRDRPEADACERCGSAHVDPSSVAGEYVQLLGLYLGDGCIASHPRGVYKLRLTLDARYPALVDESRALLTVVAPRNRVAAQLRSGGFATSSPGSNVELYVYSKAWPCLLPQHGAGRKHERPIVLQAWQRRLVAEHPRRLLRGLVQSDGCRFINTGTNWTNPRYSFSNRSEDIRGIFCDTCDLLDIRWTLAPHTVYVSRKADVARLDEFIGPKA